jgi:aminoglycoside 6'-N-acetyltransferase I
VVRKDEQGNGYGRLLVEDIERLARSSRVLTLFAGTGDTRGRTSLSGTEIYRDPPSAMATISCDGPHAYKFWLRVGFTVVGVMPDAEGIGRHGIHLARSVAREGTGGGR